MEKARYILAGAIMTGYSLTLVDIAYTLCYETTTLGGHIPFALLVTAPLAGVLFNWMSASELKTEAQDQQTYHG
jgi:hypothetical protein